MVKTSNNAKKFSVSDFFNAGKINEGKFTVDLFVYF